MRFAVTLLLAATATTAALVAQAEFSAERIKAHVTFLADDLLEGREAGTRGHEIAARYIAAQFALLGVQPAGQNGTYFQTAEFVEARATDAARAITIRTAAGTQTFEHRKTAIIRGSVVGGEVRVNAPLVFVGFGMQDAAAGVDDYDGLDVRGKIVVALFDTPKYLDSEIGAHLLREQATVAAAHGAVAILSVQTRRGAAAFPWQAVLTIGDEPIASWVRKDGTAFDPLAGLKTDGLIDPAAAGSLFAGAPRTYEQVLDDADRPEGRVKGFPLAASAEVAVTTVPRRFSSPEVIGVIPGSDPRLKNEYVALMAHADHIGIKDSASGDRINNGALDNAAGAATLIEVARALMNARPRPRRSILIVANTAEEKGMLGAEYFAHYPTVPIDRITAAVDLDMPLLLYDFTDVVAYGAAHSTLGGAFQRAGRAMGVELSPDPMPEQAVFVRSDHYAMVKAGVPAVILATGMANGGQAAWATFLANNYHQPSDDVNLPIVWSAGAKFADFNYRVVTELANADAPARWYEGDYFGNLFAAKSPKAKKPDGR